MIQISLTDFSLLCLPVCRPHEARKVFDLRQKACIAAAKRLCPFSVVRVNDIGREVLLKDSQGSWRPSCCSAGIFSTLELKPQAAGSFL